MSETTRDDGTLLLLILSFTVAELALPPNLQIRILALPINVQPTLLLIDASFAASLGLSLLSSLSERYFRGRFGRELRGFLGLLKRAIQWMLPAEIIYIIGFLAIAVNNTYVGANFTLYFPIGLYAILFLFTWDQWRNIAVGIYKLGARLRYEFKNYRKIHRPPPPGSRPLTFYVFSATVYRFGSRSGPQFWCPP